MPLAATPCSFTYGDLARDRLELVRAGLEPSGPAAIGGPRPGPLVRVVAVLVDVPVRAAAVPDGAGQGGPQLAVEILGCPAADLDPAGVGAGQFVERRDDVVDRRLDDVD